jgi:capsular polysaccharide export protein
MRHALEHLGMIGSYDRRLSTDHRLEQVFGGPIRFLSGRRTRRGIRALAVWAQNKDVAKRRALAAKHGWTVLELSEGPIKALLPGDLPLSIVIKPAKGSSPQSCIAKDHGQRSARLAQLWADAHRFSCSRDSDPPPAMAGQRPVAECVGAILSAGTVCFHPEDGSLCEPEAVLEWLALQRRMRSRFPSLVYALGFSRWRRANVRLFLQGSEVRFVRHASEVPAHGAVAVWGRRFPELNADTRRRVIRIEDGFLRSVGLGAHLARPLSWAMDEVGIYYDSTRPSALEKVLQNADMGDDLLRRAAALRERVVGAKLTKYNVGSSQWRPPHKSGRVILVPGQVESDESIRFGASQIRTNLHLVRVVREANPAAYVIYKVHPDVLAGMRETGDGELQAKQWCNEVVSDVSMAELLEHADEVHTLTSLTGFEALLRGKRVVTYGQPFYAGWGLTEDTVQVSRRTRRLTLDELVAGALILYPVYVSGVTQRYTTPERALAELLAWRARKPRNGVGEVLLHQLLRARSTLKRMTASQE